MLCDNCHEHEAVIHIQEIIGKSAASMHLCKSCAESQGLLPGSGQEIDLSSMVSNLTAKALAKAEEPETSPFHADPARTCPNCGLTGEEFNQTGRLGCPDCYETFAESLALMLPTMHRGAQHTADEAPEPDDSEAPRPDVAELRRELRRAVSSEAYERAAELRDRIERLMTAREDG